MYFEDEKELPAVDREAHDRAVIKRAEANGFAALVHDSVRKVIEHYNAGSRNNLGCSVSWEKYQSIQSKDIKASKKDVTDTLGHIRDYVNIYVREHEQLVKSIEIEIGRASYTNYVSRINVTLNETGEFSSLF